MNTLDRSLVAVALVVACGASAAATTVPGSANPKLAGMSDGTAAGGGDSAPGQSPVLFTEFAISAGQLLQFVATGETDHCGGGCAGGTPDGTAIWQNGAENGISGINAPINALLGVFLGTDQPSLLAAAPAPLDFGADGLGTNFTSLATALQQVFFIGDGQTAGGVPQQFTVPTGATRLYLASHDGFGWYNNSGSFSVEVSAVPEPGGWALMLAGGAAVAALLRRRRRQVE